MATTTKVMFLMFVILQSSMELPSNDTKCPTCLSRDQKGCFCTCDVMYNKTAVCKVDHMTDIHKYLSSQESIHRLDLSNNHIQDIPANSFSNLTQLIHLNLAQNNIHTLRRDAFIGLAFLQELSLESNNIKTINQRVFRGLAKLRVLNLSHNNIQMWNTSGISQDIPQLRVLNIVQNSKWIPDQNLLSLPRISVINILFVWMTAVGTYMRCFLLTNSSVGLLEGVKFSWKNFSLSPTFPKLMNCHEPKLLIQNGTVGRLAESNPEFEFYCDLVKGPVPPDNLFDTNNREGWYKISFRDHCWKTINMILIVSLLIGCSTMVFNLVVVVTTLLSAALRGSVAHVLVANIAVGDLLISVYLIIITITRQLTSSAEYDDLYLKHYCKLVGFIFLVGQFSSPIMVFFTTLERYLAIVYCMKPHIRISMVTSYVVMTTVWPFTVFLAVCFLISPSFSQSCDRMCIPLPSEDNVHVLGYIGGVGVILYLVCIALYIHIYIDVKKNSVTSDHFRKESRLARRISLIIISNSIFFIVPMAVIAVVLIPEVERLISNDARFVFWHTFGFICLGINSCLNPVLFSFRNDKFTKEFRKHCFPFYNSVAAINLE